jgi:hypothetical protein
MPKDREERHAVINNDLIVDVEFLVAETAKMVIREINHAPG